MKRIGRATFTAGICVVASAVLAAQNGETWGVVTQAESGGMMLPETSMTLCLEKGAPRDPAKMMRRDECQVSDVKTSGPKTSWKVHCKTDDGEMNGTGEVTSQADRYAGSTHMVGNSDGRAIEMQARFKGTRIGAPCDPAAPPVVAIKGMENIGEMMGMASRQMAGAMAEQCEVANYDATELISSRFFGPQAMCPGKEKFACKVITKEAPRNVDVFLRLAKYEDTSETSIAQKCSIDMAATGKSICKLVDAGNHEQLADQCPDEAKTFAQRNESSTSGAAGGVSSTLDSAIDAGKKLKGLFGF